MPDYSRTSTSSKLLFNELIRLLEQNTEWNVRRFPTTEIDEIFNYLCAVQTDLCTAIYFGTSKNERGTSIHNFKVLIACKGFVKPELAVEKWQEFYNSVCSLVDYQFYNSNKCFFKVNKTDPYVIKKGSVAYLCLIDVTVDDN